MMDVEMVELLSMSGSTFSRWLSRFFAGPLRYLYLVAGVLTVAGWVVGIFVQLSGTVAFLLWTGPLTIFTTSIIIGLFYATLSGHDEPESDTAPTEKPAEVRSATRPNIRFLGWETTEAPLTVADTTEADGKSRPWLTRVTFVNEPDQPDSGSIASQVSGHIEFYDASRDRFLFGMVGQWSESREGEIHAVTTNQIDLVPDASPYYLDLALKYDEDDECYGVNNDTAARAPDDWRDEQRKLSHGLYTIKIMIHGTNITETFWFGLINRGSGQRVRILRISS